MQVVKSTGLGTPGRQNSFGARDSTSYRTMARAGPYFFGVTRPVLHQTM